MSTWIVSGDIPPFTPWEMARQQESFYHEALEVCTKVTCCPAAIEVSCSSVSISFISFSVSEPAGLLLEARSIMTNCCYVLREKTNMRGQMKMKFKELWRAKDRRIAGLLSSNLSVVVAGRTVLDLCLRLSYLHSVCNLRRDTGLPGLTPPGLCVSLLELFPIISVPFDPR